MSACALNSHSTFSRCPAWATSEAARGSSRHGRYSPLRPPPRTNERQAPEHGRTCPLLARVPEAGLPCPSVTRVAGNQSRESAQPDRCSAKGSRLGAERSLRVGFGGGGGGGSANDDAFSSSFFVWSTRRVLQSRELRVIPYLASGVPVPSPRGRYHGRSKSQATSARGSDG